MWPSESMAPFSIFTPYVAVLFFKVFCCTVLFFCRLVCGASWFDFTSDESSTNYAGGKMKSGDFAILSHLKDLGCGEIIRRPQEVHFSGCINESYTFNATGGDFFIKINR